MLAKKDTNHPSIMAKLYSKKVPTLSLLQ
jgi:hypothetical protein